MEVKSTNVERHDVPPDLLSRFLDVVSNWGRGKKRILALVVDMALVAFSVWAAYALRLSVWTIDLKSTWYLFAALPVLTAVTFTVLGIYRWVVRSSTFRFTTQILKGVAISTIFMISILFLFPPTFAGTPRSIFILYGLALLASTLGVRYIWRLLVSRSGNLKRGEPVALYGAGYAGRQLYSLLKNSKEYKPVLFLDDELAYRGSTVSGLQVHPFEADSIKDLLKRFEVTSVILSMPSVDGQKYSEIIESLPRTGISIKTIPAITDLLLGKAAIDEVRELKIEDLLGRAPVEADLNHARAFVEGKCILVTGGGGSIGSEIARQMFHMRAAKIVVIEQSEENLYKLIENLNEKKRSSEYESNTEFVPVLGSVNDRTLVANVISKHGVEQVYHAAACKHVPIVESNPAAGIQTNVFGTLIVLEESIRLNVNSFVLISTDKAVRPENVMGASKRLAEMILQAKAAEKPDTRICMVRFGNVLGSSGSVVPKFLQQLDRGGPITVTHPDMTRYFMTIPEASQLVIQASTLSGNGEVFVLDMGEPVKIVDLAKAMIKIQGKKLITEDPKNGIEIVYDGIRPGEKINEELFISDSVSPTPYEKILHESVDAANWSELSFALTQLGSYLESGDSENIAKYLKELTTPNSVANHNVMNGMAAGIDNKTLMLN